MTRRLVFLCGARDYHAMDWYRSARLLLPGYQILVVTDLTGGEGYQNLLRADDDVRKLLILDKLLFHRESKFGSIWRNVLKLLVLPIQIALLRRLSRENQGAIYHAHSMYYLWLAWGARVPFIGTPQGSDILLKPKKSIVYRWLSKRALAAAQEITVDSMAMSDETYALAKRTPRVIQNGIDMSSIRATIGHLRGRGRKRCMSIRGLTPLYRIQEILSSRNLSACCSTVALTIIYPFLDDAYAKQVLGRAIDSDVVLGRVGRQEMYRLFSESFLVISIPSSDSSPRSVYEAIFCGAVVAITANSYYDALPRCMRDRIIVIDLGEPDWFGRAVVRAREIVRSPFEPTEETLDAFDQLASFKILNEIFDRGFRALS